MTFKSDVTSVGKIIKTRKPGDPAYSSAPPAEPIIPLAPQVSGNARVLPLAASTNLSGAARLEKSRLKMSHLSRTIHGGIEVSTIIVTAESNKFSLLPPDGWRVEADAPQKRIQLVRTKTGSRILVNIVETGPSRITERSRETLSELTLDRFPGAKIVEELRLSALGNAGQGLDVEWRTASGSRRKVRAGFVPFASGDLDCVLTSSPEDSVQDCQAFNQLLLSLRCAPLGATLDLPIVTAE